MGIRVIYTIGAILILSFLTGVTYAQITPDLYISEFLADPSDPLESEWIELHNRSATPIDLSLYQIGDRLGLRHISENALLLDPDGYVILAQDTAGFHAYYGSFSCPIFTPLGWQGLNNDGDLIRLADLGGLIIDSVEYSKGFGSNRSWERFLDNSGLPHWGESFDPSGSTLCRENSYFYPPPNTIEISINPNPFSPDGDSFEDQAVIRYEVPTGGSLTMRLYDIAGRIVRRFADNKASLPGEIIWDGRDENGERLPIGIYILYVKVDDGRIHETKKTIVLAR